MGAGRAKGWCTVTATFESTVIPLRDNLYGAAMRLTRDPDQADDLLQDTLTRAWRFWSSFDGKAGSARAWLFTIMRNTFINGYHAAGRRERLVEAMATQADALSVPPTDPDDALDREVTHRQVLAALERLPPDYREAVTLADLDGLSYLEIAEAMGCPIGTVMSRIHRGRKLLRSMTFERGVAVGMVDDDDDDNLVRLAPRQTTRPTAQMSLFGGAS